MYLKFEESGNLLKDKPSVNYGKPNYPL